MIDPSIWDDEDVGGLSDGAFRVLMACISNADDEGRLLGGSRRFKGLVFRFRNTEESQVQGYIEEIARAMRSVCFYTVQGRDYVALLNWSRYQYIRKPYPSSIPAPPVSSEPVRGDAPVTHQCSTSDAPVTHHSGHEEKRREEKRIEEKRNPPTPHEGAVAPSESSGIFAAYAAYQPGGLQATMKKDLLELAEVYEPEAVAGAIWLLKQQSEVGGCERPRRLVPYLRKMLANHADDGADYHKPERTDGVWLDRERGVFMPQVAIDANRKRAEEEAAWEERQRKKREELAAEKPEPEGGPDVAEA